MPVFSIHHHKESNKFLITSATADDKHVKNGGYNVEFQTLDNLFKKLPEN